METVKWCCGPFKAHYDEAGLRGLGILIYKDLKGIARVILQFRAVDKDMEKVDCSTTIPLTLVNEGHISYCPWCGVLLKEHYKSSAELLYREGFTNEIPAMSAKA